MLLQQLHSAAALIPAHQCETTPSCRMSGLLSQQRSNRRRLLSQGACLHTSRPALCSAPQTSGPLLLPAWSGFRLRVCPSGTCTASLSRTSLSPSCSTTSRLLSAPMPALRSPSRPIPVAIFFSVSSLHLVLLKKWRRRVSIRRLLLKSKIHYLPFTRR